MGWFDSRTYDVAEAHAYICRVRQLLDADPEIVTHRCSGDLPSYQSLDIRWRSDTRSGFAPVSIWFDYSDEILVSFRSGAMAIPDLPAEDIHHLILGALSQAPHAPLDSAAAGTSWSVVFGDDGEADCLVVSFRREMEEAAVPMLEVRRGAEKDSLVLRSTRSRWCAVQARCLFAEDGVVIRVGGKDFHLLGRSARSAALFAIGVLHGAGRTGMGGRRARARLRDAPSVIWSVEDASAYLRTCAMGDTEFLYEVSTRESKALVRISASGSPDASVSVLWDGGIAASVCLPGDFVYFRVVDEEYSEREIREALDELVEVGKQYLRLRPQPVAGKERELVVAMPEGGVTMRNGRFSVSCQRYYE